MRSSAILALLCSFLAGASSCSSAAGGDTILGGSGGSGLLAPDGGGGSGAALIDASPGDASGPPLQGEVYGHSAKVLYRLEPVSKTVTTVGTFDCGDFSSGNGMWDIAIDKDGAMFGSLNQGMASALLVRIDKATAHCEKIAEAQSLPNALTFVPAGTLDPNEEVLVGFDNTAYVRIDKATGAKKTIGDLNPNPTGEMWESSGDVVSIINDKTYLTVAVWGNASSSEPDTIIEVDPVTGKALKVLGNTGFADLYGLGYWGGVAYGFSAAGELCEIDLGTGKGVAIPLANMPSGLSFWGAGVTTAAPITVPK